MDVAGVCRALGVSRQTVYRAIEAGLPANVKSNGLVRGYEIDDRHVAPYAHAGPTYTTAEVAALLGCGARNVRKLADSGALRSYPCLPGTGRHRFDVAEVNAYVAARGSLVAA